VKRLLPWLAGVGILTVVLVVGLTQAGGKSGGEPAKPFDLAKARQALRGAPAPLAELHAQSSRLLGGGVPAFEARLAALKGHPVVINKWASWCNPCRAEFPAFQRVATARGKQVAFLGVNGTDSTQPARRFLARYPVPFPSYVDPHEKIAQKLGAPKNYPMTVFVDARGRVAFIRSGGYSSTGPLEQDIDHYLG
jgi:cytochrome c biogenesis protein CcmG, thiol:disulfide interchange protein DsbE